jgi:hypothetical protein
MKASRARSAGPGSPACPSAEECRRSRNARHRVSDRGACLRRRTGTRRLPVSPCWKGNGFQSARPRSDPRREGAPVRSVTCVASAKAAATRARRPIFPVRRIAPKPAGSTPASIPGASAPPELRCPDRGANGPTTAEPPGESQSAARGLRRGDRCVPGLTDPCGTPSSASLKMLGIRRRPAAWRIPQDGAIIVRNRPCFR